MKWIHRLFAHYKAYHQHGPLLLRYMSLLVLFGFPLLYLLRFTKTAPSYNDLPLRLVNVVILLGLLLRDRWPESLKRYYLPYSYAVMIITLPLTFVFTSLKNGGGPGAIGNTFMAVFLLILLADWRNMVVMLLTGFASAAVLYVLTDPDPRLPMDYVARLPVLIAAVVGGSLFKSALEQATAERVRQAYGSLAGSIAHEMRNPLTQLKHNLESMQQALPLPTVASREQAVEGAAIDELYRHVAHGELAVSRGLQVIAMTLDEVNAKPLDPAAFSYLSASDAAGKAVREYGYASELQRGRVRLEVSQDFVFKGDETAFVFVLFNLIKNALYYLPVRPQLEVVITVAEQEIRVRDTGPGMTDDVLAHVFEPFRSAGKTGGTGLGLAYCRRVMHSFGGEIGCRSVPGEHTEFAMRFPAVAAADLQAHQARLWQQATAAFAGRRVLVVDDDDTARQYTVHKLSDTGIRVDTASSAAEALALLGRTSYDLLVTDLYMPGMDGYELAARIRRGRVGHQDVPILAHSSEPGHVAEVKARKAGMDGFASKPSSQLALLLAMQRALDRHQGARRAKALAGRTVVVADDNSWNRRAVSTYLQQAGIAVVEAEHGEAVLALLRGGQSCDAVLLDIHMPGLGGYQTARALRADPPGGRRLAIVAMTARSDAAAVEAAKAAGMDDFVTKPVSAAGLYETLERLLSQAENGGGAVVAREPWVGYHRAPPAPQEALLDVDRLENYARLGLLDELVDEGLPELERLVDTLRTAVTSIDFQGCLETLHALLGMTGEVGAAALYRRVRSLYVPMLEHRRWPAEEGWESDIGALAKQTVSAVRKYRQDRQPTGVH
ncbi:ATP-binding response regulator [Ramlibacter tataouinensis]|uniref:histidine kinase n=1 Tax=Ramlibacter tataouinensis (strain ATCC BAA-407 / DSM 14655 / LMG 21543 / TTB310) TaxID=365046 RepID=F5XXX3_RAMTT|nr:hybrid sensor histidine kinase/response regulator [Ramlibacter tataouinensis]AEG93108.1 candidate histidine kinase, atypical unorthodox [Ramlibacter tataouinensis TTB310]